MDIEQILKEDNFSSEIINEISNILKAEIIGKGEYFVKYNNKMDRIGIIMNGLLVSRFVSEGKKTITSKFYHSKGDIFIADFFSFKNQTISNEEIQAVEDSYLMTISYKNYNYLIKKYPEVQKLVSEYLEENYLKALDRVRDFQTLFKIYK